MEFLKLAKERYSVRKYSTDKVEDAKIAKLLEAAQVSPTAGNKQPQRIYVVKSDEGLEKLYKATPCIYGAPLAMLVCYDNEVSWKREKFDNKDHGEIDASIIVSSMMYEATDLGLGSVWVCHFDPESVIKEFDLPDNIIPSSILTIGYAAEDAIPAPKHSERFSIEEIVKFV